MVRRGAVALLALAAVLGAATPAQAVDAPTGIDVSRNQGAAVWPGAPDFAIVAVNDGLPNTGSGLLPGALERAALLPGTTHPRAEVYVNTANPPKEQAQWWPSGDRTRRGAAVSGPYGHCGGGETAACSYIYGASIAADDLETMGVPAGVPSRWWLDVEDANSWAGTPIPDAASRQRNRAVLEGMTATLQHAGQRVGLYALAVHFATLIGDVPSTSGIASLPTWLAGAGDQQQAASFCSRAPFARGRVQLVQWADRSTADRFDHDLACATFASSPTPTIRGTHRVGRTLVAVPGTWRPAAHLAYRWTRDGTTIATGRTYRATKADAGHLLRVVATATATGVSRGEHTSAAVRIAR